MNKTDLTTAFEQTSFLYGGNAQFIEQLHAKYLENPAAVDQHWRQFFAGLEDNAEQAKKVIARYPEGRQQSAVMPLSNDMGDEPPQAPRLESPAQDLQMSCNGVRIWYKDAIVDEVRLVRLQL